MNTKIFYNIKKQIQSLLEHRSSKVLFKEEATITPNYQIYVSAMKSPKAMKVSFVKDYRHGIYLKIIFKKSIFII